MEHDLGCEILVHMPKLTTELGVEPTIDLWAAARREPGLCSCGLRRSKFSIPKNADLVYRENLEALISRRRSPFGPVQRGLVKSPKQHKSDFDRHADEAMALGNSAGDEGGTVIDARQRFLDRRLASHWDDDRDSE